MHDWGLPDHAPTNCADTGRSCFIILADSFAVKSSAGSGSVSLVNAGHDGAELQGCVLLKSCIPSNNYGTLNMVAADAMLTAMFSLLVHLE